MPRPACGDHNGYRAHKNRGEDACDACKAGAAAYERGRRKARAAAKAAGLTLAGPGRPRRDDGNFIAEVEHLAYSGEGWGPICTLFRLTPAALERRLMRHGRHDLATRIFGTERYNITQGKAAA
jgi:hypothetical protein